MNREITTKKVGRQKKLTNPCPVIKGEVLDINGRVWFKVPLEKLKDHEYLLGLLGTAFWFPVSKEYNAERIKILECALEDLERIKRRENQSSLLLHLKNLKYTHDGRFSKAYQRGRGNPYAYRRDLE
jgi:hypothetical protein